MRVTPLGGCGVLAWKTVATWPRPTFLGYLEECVESRSWESNGCFTRRYHLQFFTPEVHHMMSGVIRGFVWKIDTKEITVSILLVYLNKLSYFAMPYRFIRERGQNTNLHANL